MAEWSGKHRQEEMDNAHCVCLYEYVKISGISAITFMALEDALDVIDENSYMFDWKKLRLNSIRRNLLFDQERNAITNFFDQNGIWYLPLKGSVIKDIIDMEGEPTRNYSDIYDLSQFPPKVKTEYMVGAIVKKKEGLWDYYSREEILKRKAEKEEQEKGRAMH